MSIILLFAAAFALAFVTFKRRGQKTADCIHKGLVAGIVACVFGFGIVTAFSYI